MSKRYYTFATVGLCLITQTASKEVLKKINRWSFHKKKVKMAIHGGADGSKPCLELKNSIFASLMTCCNEKKVAYGLDPNDAKNLCLCSCSSNSSRKTKPTMPPVSLKSQGFRWSARNPAGHNVTNQRLLACSSNSSRKTNPRFPEKPGISLVRERSGRAERTDCARACSGLGFIRILTSFIKWKRSVILKTRTF